MIDCCRLLLKNAFVGNLLLKQSSMHREAWIVSEVYWTIWLGKLETLQWTDLLNSKHRYHYHLKPQAQQIHQLFPLVVSMAADLAISHKPKRPVIQRLAKSQAKSKSPSEQREAHRAFLGCYCFCKRLHSDQEISFGQHHPTHDQLIPYRRSDPRCIQVGRYT